MKFTLTRKHLYWWPVKVAVPHPDKDRAGEQLEMEFRMQFESLPRSEADRLAELMKADPSAHAHADIRLVARDWDGVVDDDGDAVAFTAEALDEFMQISWYRLAVYRAWGASLVGDAARLGN